MSTVNTHDRKTVVSREAFVIERVFDAPRELVFDVWTDPEHLKHWLSPKGFSVRYVHAEVRPGGVLHSCMSGPGGMQMWGKSTFREIERPTRLTYVQSFSDEQGGLTRHPMNENWPLEMLTTVLFEAQGKKTKVTLTWLPIHASDEELAAFDQGRPSMTQGWGGTMEQLEAYLRGVRRG